MTLNGKILLIDSIGIVLSLVVVLLNYKNALNGNASAQIWTLIFGVSFVVAIVHLLKAYLNAHKPEPSTKGDLDGAENRIQAYTTKTKDEIIDHLTTKSLKIYTSAPDLLDTLPKIKKFGFKNIVDRPESEAIINAFNNKTKFIIVEGKPTSGKSFLAFLVARKWISSGGCIVWLKVSNLDKYETQTLLSNSQPLIIWDPPEPSSINSNTFDLLYNYPGKTLITLRVGDLSSRKRESDNQYRSLVNDYGIHKTTHRNGEFDPCLKSIHFFLGPIENVRTVLSKNIDALYKGKFTIEKSGEVELINRIKGVYKEENTTLIGIARAYLMVFHKLGLNKINKASFENLKNKYSILQDEDEFRNILLKTLTSTDIKILWVMRRLRDWTSKNEYSKLILDSSLDAHDIDNRLALKDLIDSGFIVINEKMYSVWSDIQLDLLGEDSPVKAEEKLQLTIENLKTRIQLSAEVKNIQSSKEAIESTIVFLWELIDNNKIRNFEKIVEEIINTIRKFYDKSQLEFYYLFIHSLHFWAVYLSKTKQIEKAVRFFFFAIACSHDYYGEEPEFESGIAFLELIWNDMAWACYENEDYKNAICAFEKDCYYLKSLVDKGRSKYKDRFAQSMLTLGALLKNDDQFFKAYLIKLNALEYFLELQKCDSTEKTLQVIADLNIELYALELELLGKDNIKRLKAAKNDYEKLIKINEKKYVFGLAATFLSFGKHYEFESDLPNACKYYEKSHTIYENHSDSEYTQIYKNNLLFAQESYLNVLNKLKLDKAQ